MSPIANTHSVTPSELLAALTFAFANGFPYLITGAPGIGKTDIIKKAAKDAGCHLIISHPVVSDPTDYKGLPFAAKGQADFLPYGDLRAIMNATEPTVFFLDDLGQAPPSVQAACMQLLLAREINGKKVADCVTFAAATNRAADKAGVTGVLEPVKSRFNSILELQVSTEDWLQWALNEGNMPIELIAFIRFKPDLLYNWTPSKEIVNASCPRTVAAVGRQFNAGIPQGLERQIITGAAGEGFATEFVAFLNIFRSLPNIDQIFMNPDSVEVPTEPSVLYATMAAVSNKMNETNADNAFTYIKRLPVEAGVFCAKSATAKNRDLLHTRAFIKFAEDKGNLLMT